MTPARPATNFTYLALEGARKVLTDCISLSSGDVLALFWDESTVETADVFRKAADQLKLTVQPRFVRVEEQKRFSETEGLSAADRDALDRARGIITCLSNHGAGMPYRSQLLHVGTDGGKRFGHMPGVNLAVLAHAVNIDYNEAILRCDNLALALTLGQKARLRTYVPATEGSHVQAYDLEFLIGGLSRSPITSTGIIPLGTWGNLPGGETFIAPIEDTAKGIFVLNGAFKDYVIKPPAYLRLYFERGRMMSIDGNLPEQKAFNEILHARAPDDAFYDCLAELGIGVNRGITELTGNALFDEKCYGTAHIAIGDSSRYGGRNSSSIHEDLISRRPSLWIDDKPILDRGKDAFDRAQWREELTDQQLDDPLDPKCMITRTTIAADGGAFGRLCVRRSVAGRVCNYTVGEPETSRMLAHVYSFLPRLGKQIDFEELAEHCEQREMTPGMTAAALRILVRHGLIDLRNPTDPEVHHDH